MGHQELDIFKILLNSSIIVQLVLLILIAASVLSWAIIFKKFKQIKSLREENHRFLKKYGQAKNFEEVMPNLSKSVSGTYALMFQRGVQELQQLESDGIDPDRLSKHFSVYGLNLIERALEQGAHKANLKLETMLSTLASIGSITPFVGLFGTVWGIVNSFTGLASGGNTLDAVAPGIAEALVATAVGLFAAIPAVWFYNYFTAQNSKLNVQMESFANDFLNNVEKRLIRD